MGLYQKGPPFLIGLLILLFLVFLVINIVRGVGEGICRLGARSFISEDYAMNIGEDLLAWMRDPKYDDSPTPMIKNITLTNFTVGSTVSYTEPSGNAISQVVNTKDMNFTIVAETEEDLRSSLDTLTLQAPLNSDDDMVIDYFVGTESGYIHRYTHPIKVLAVADPPQISAIDVLNVRTLMKRDSYFVLRHVYCLHVSHNVHNYCTQLEENSGRLSLDITATKSEDVDNSETLSVKVGWMLCVVIGNSDRQPSIVVPRQNISSETSLLTLSYFYVKIIPQITVQKDGYGPIGKISTSSLPNGISFVERAAGTWILSSSGGTPDQRETKLNQVDVFFQPREHYAAV
jgi:hypothetical protein